MTLPLPPEKLITHPDIAPLLHLLQSPSHTWLTGGTVRDSLFTLHHPHLSLPTTTTTSLDIATSLPLETVLSLLKSHNLNHTTLHPRYASLTLRIHENLYADIATLRIDTHTDGRHALIKPTHSLAKDSVRRDFTCNALSLNSHGQLFDFHQGQKAIRHRHLEFVSDPMVSLSQDILRLLRFFRFLSPFHDPLIPFPPSLLQAINHHAPRLHTLSTARKAQELKGILSSPNPSQPLSLISSLNLTPFFSPLILSPLPPRFDTYSSWHQRLALLIPQKHVLPEFFSQFQFTKKDKRLITHHLTHDDRGDPP